MDNNSQVVVITGAAQGIGKGIAQRFSESGAKLALLDVRLQPFEDWVGGLKTEFLTIKCDISSKEDVLHAREQVLSRFGCIDILVNNAGIGSAPCAFEDIKEEDWRQTIDVNLTGTFFCTQVFGKSMLDRGGAIINISSQSGLIPSPNKGAYSVSKTGVIMLTQQTALSWGGRKVRANAVCPGIIETEMSTRNYTTPNAKEARMGLIPLGRIGTTEDIANVVFFLASPESEYINGEAIRIDGGFSLTTIMQLSRI